MGPQAFLMGPGPVSARRELATLHDLKSTLPIQTATACAKMAQASGLSDDEWERASLGAFSACCSLTDEPALRLSCKTTLRERMRAEGAAGLQAWLREEGEVLQVRPTRVRRPRCASVRPETPSMQLPCMIPSNL